jgi:riboflavin synthase
MLIFICLVKNGEIMFTGIIRYTGKIKSVKNGGQGKRFHIEAPEALVSRLEKGITSIAVNGVCLTVEDMGKSDFSVYSSFETLKVTTLAILKTGEAVNLELPLTPQSLLDGHIVQGHVDGTGRISSIQKKGESFLYRFSADHSIIRYLAEKDSIAVDGISLTIFHIDSDSFQVAVIPETIDKTALSFKKEGSPVNIEVNILAKYIEKFGRQKDEKFIKFFEKK